MGDGVTWTSTCRAARRRRTAGSVKDMSHVVEQPAASIAPSRPIRAVLLDFHGTLAQLEPLTDSVRLAAAARGESLTPDRVAVLAQALADVGWVGAGRPARLPDSLAAAWERRDLSSDDHRRAFVGMAAQVEASPAGFIGLADEMYARMLAADGWIAYADTVSTLSALREAGIPTALVSNIGFDARTVLDHLGVVHLLDEVLLSFEVGAMKPDPAIFVEACRRLGVAPEETLMVGDTEADAGARAVGIRTLLVPFAGPGTVVGLDTILALVRP